MLEGFNWKGIRKELEQEPEKIDILFHLKAVHKCLEDIAELISEIYVIELRDPYNYLTNLLNEVISQYPDAVPCIAKWEGKGEMDLHCVGIIEFPLFIRAKMQDKITQLSLSQLEIKIT